MIRLFLAFLICGIIGHGPSAAAIVLKKTARQDINVLVPHRAVYEITLANKTEAVSVSAVRGRMVFEITGSPCDGYTQNMRMITSVTDERGKRSLSDIRSSTWEQGIGKRFRFSSSQYLDKDLQEIISGTATRNLKTSDIDIKIKRPDAAALELPGDVLFPTQHSLALIKAARAGKKRLDVRIYDGSEQGQGFYKTYAYIGKKIPPDSASKPKTDKEAGRLIRLGLARLPSWPIAISYFNAQGKSDDTVPSYELSFRLYLNGVSGNLLINYGKFKVRGLLDRVKYLRTGSCDHKIKKR